MNLGMSEMIFIFILALLIFGPRKLPEIAREVGKFMAEFKRAGNEFRTQIETEIQNLELEEQIKKDAEKREAAMREAEQKRLEARGQGELFESPQPAENPRAIAQNASDEDGAPEAGIPGDGTYENPHPIAQNLRDEDGAPRAGIPDAGEMPKILPPEGTVVNTRATPKSSLAEEQAPLIESEAESEHQTEPNA